jgi:hypothetical protein
VVAPVTVTVLIVAVAPPVLVSVTCCEALLPVRTEPNVRDVVDALRVATAPLPLAAMEVGEFVALLATETVAERAPALCGANVTVRVAVAPAAMVAPFAIPLME